MESSRTSHTISSEVQAVQSKFYNSLSKVTDGVDICIDFWTSYSTAIRCRCGQCLRLQTKVQIFPSRVYSSSCKMPLLTSFMPCALTLLCALLRVESTNLCPGSGIRSPLSPSCSGYLLHNRVRDKKASEAPSTHVPWLR